MKIFIRVFSLVVMLILGIFLGIDYAEKNIQKIQGTEGAPRTVQVIPKDGKVEISVFGNKIETNNPKAVEITEEAKKEITKISSLSNDIGTNIKTTTREVMEFLFGWLK